MIPGGSTLHFDIELLDVEEGPQPVNVFKQIDADADNQLSREELSSYLKQQVSRSYLKMGSFDRNGIFRRNKGLSLISFMISV